MSVALPDKLSDLAELALGDLRKCEADPRYKVNMKVWHQVGFDKRCEVCLAGAVLAKSFNVPETQDTMPYQHAPQLSALENLRCGYVKGALWEFGIRGVAGFDNDVVVPLYEVNRPGFYAAIEKIIKLLRERGL